jgi:lauroyl/myristoyl acyltransferase/predicted metal-dependent phosphoesterase TrpH
MATTGADEISVPQRRLLDRTILTAVSALTRLAWMVPWPVWSALALLGAVVTMCSKRRHVVLENVRHARAAAPPARIVAWYIGMQQIATHLRAVIGTLRGGFRLPDATRHLVLEGIEQVRPHLGQRGLIIVAPHAGPYTMLGLMGRRWLADQGFSGELAIVARMFRPFRSGALMQWFMDYFTEAGVTVITVHEQPQSMAKRLKAVLEKKGIVVLLVDEPTPTPSAVVPFFDSAIKMPLGPVRLARATNSLIVPTIASYEPGRKMKITLAPPQEPTGSVTEDMHRLAGTLERLVSRNLSQWAMLTPIWIDEKPGTPAPPDGHSYADLHLHTQGSDGLLRAEEWLDAAKHGAIQVIAITDHDHIETVRAWKERDPESTRQVIPGVELTARGRIVHLGVLFTKEIPVRLPRAGRPLLELVRWARRIEGSVVVLVHPLPMLWRRQLRGMARAGLLPDAIESRFPFGGSGGRTAAIERAARHYDLAVLGSSDAHLSPGQLGCQATLFPGATVEDLLEALRQRRTRAVVLRQPAHVPGGVHLLQSAYSWLQPLAVIPGVPRVRAAILRRARAALQQGGRRRRIRISRRPSAQANVRVS